MVRQGGLEHHRQPPDRGDRCQRRGRNQRFDLSLRLSGAPARQLLHRRIHLENRPHVVHRQVHRLHRRQPDRDGAVRQDDNARRADPVQLRRRWRARDQQRRTAEPGLHRRHTAYRQPVGHLGQLARPRVQKDNQRLNLEWRLGHHTLNFGIDNQKSEGIDVGSVLSGPGFAWTYGQTNDPNGLATGGLVSQSANEAGGIGAPSPGLVDPVNGSSGYYVVRNINTSLYSYEAKQRAYYIEDKWQVTDNLLLSIGLRKDEFTNYTPFGDPYIEVDNAWAPRLGFSWDVNGDSSLKVFGNLGRYYLGLPLSAGG
ncbi:TonB-dependent receptor domain-containing protein, partial [Xanthomonas vesicatoria]|uniref:TonB-dependent receptor domain-containing protein n=1 Tax=Xanthomonas vesicatoria TaxID=56460 RepID=UPI002E8149E6